MKREEKRRHGRVNQVLGRLDWNGEREGENSLGNGCMDTTDEKQRHKRK